MDRRLRDQLLIVLTAGLVFFTNLGATRLWDMDETLYAQIAREMVSRGDWVVPMFNGHLFPEKPPLMFWTIMGGLKLFGGAFGARFGAACFGIGTALVTYHLGRRLFRAEVGLWAGLIVASTLIFTVSARAATVDAALAFSTALAMLLVVVGTRRGADTVCRTRRVRLSSGTGPVPHALDTESGTGPVPHTDELAVMPSWPVWALIYACLGVAVLAKGPIGLLLPVASLGLFFSFVRCPPGAPLPPAAAWYQRWTNSLRRALAPRQFLETTWQMRPLTAIAVVGLVAGSWYALVGYRTHGEWLQGFITKFNVRPFSQPIQGHSGPIYYHVLGILIGFFPWSVFLGAALVEQVRRIRQGHPWRAGYVLLACWTGVFFVFWSICKTKLPHYLVPTYPALALLTGCFIDGWLTAPARIPRRVPLSAAITLMVVGIGLVVAMPFVAAVVLPGEAWLGLFGLPLVAGGGLCLFYAWHNRPERFMPALVVTAIVFLVGIFGFAAVRVDSHQDTPALIAQIRQAAPDGSQLAAFRFFRESMVYFSQQPVPHFENPAEVRTFLDQSPHPYLFTTSDHAAEVAALFPGELDIVFRRPRFLAKGELLVFARRADWPRPAVGDRIAVEAEPPRR